MEERITIAIFAVCQILRYLDGLFSLVVYWTIWIIGRSHIIAVASPQILHLSRKPKTTNEIL